MKRGGWGIALLASLCIALAIVITTSSTTPIVRSPDAVSAATPTVAPTPSVGTATASPPSKPQPQQADLPRVVWFLLYGLLLVLAGLLLWLLWGLVERRRRKAQVAGFTPSDLDTFDADAEQRLVDVVQEQLADLSSGSPRNAGVACWLALEEAVTDTGLYRHPSSTSVEFTETVIEAYTLNEAAIRRLSALYREARFSSHAITEQHRQAAARALQTLSAELSHRVSRKPRDEEPAQ